MRRLNSSNLNWPRSADGDGFLEIGSANASGNTQLVCGHFEFDEKFRHPLVQQLPTYIVINENNGTEYTWLKDSLKFMSHIARNRQLGSGAIIKRLSEIIFVQAVKHWSYKQGSQEGFLAALNDPQLSKSLRAFHDDFSANWTVEDLASRAGMSRSLFADRFKAYLQLSPMQYVTHWRMQNALGLLTGSRTSLEQIANLVGYESLASFSKAFKRTMGVNPSEYRSSRHQSLEVAS